VLAVPVRPHGARSDAQVAAGMGDVQDYRVSAETWPQSSRSAVAPSPSSNSVSLSVVILNRLLGKSRETLSIRPVSVHPMLCPRA